MLNSGRRGKRAPDGYGIQSVNEKFNQANYPIPIIDSWSITDGSYNPIDDTALDTAGGQTVVVYGSGFTSGVTVNINGTNISPVTLLDSNRLTFTSPTLASASYTIYVSNTDGATAIYVPGLVYSGLPTWSSPSAGSIGTGYETKSTNLLSSNTFIATGDAPITYSITSGNLPSGVTLSSNGVLSGSLPATASSTTYSFTITASDAQNQDSSRSFSLTINPDVVTWVAPTQNGSLTVYETKAFSTPLSATSAAGYGVMYAANTLPTGITLSTDSGALNGYANTVGTTNAMLTATANTTGRYSTSNVLFTVTQDSVTWSSPANNTTYALNKDAAMSSVPLAATSAAGYGVQYTANSLPTGVTLSGNTISGTPTVMGTSTTEIIATANTTNRVSYVYINWSVTIAVDTYFANTVMLLSANSQLQTASFITDNSNNNSQLTIAGDTKPNLFNPYRNGYYSNYFDGTGDYLQVSSISPVLGSGDFTLECWVYPQALGAIKAIYGWRNGADTSIQLLLDASNRPTFGGDITNFLVSSTSVTLNNWYHIAVTRNGSGSNNMKMYLNGVVVATATNTSNFSYGSGINIGTFNGATPYSYTGYISNLRVVVGSAVYTAAFTPPTTPLTAVSGTQLLTCQSPRLIDNSVNNFVITKNGDTTVSSAYPFPTPTTSSYNTQYSTYFDGTGDYLSATSNAVFAFGTGDYTLEFWIYPTVALSSTRCFYNNNSGGYFLQWASGSGLQTGIAGSSTTGTYSASINTSQWTHVAISRASGSSRCFINGTQSGTTLTDNTNYTQNGAYIGALYEGSQAFTGYISNLRVVKGQALYTSTFTPSTTPLTTTSQSATASNVSLLTCQNSTLIDNSTNALAITSAGQAQPVAVSPFTMTTSTNTVTSLGSAYFDGTSDVLTLAAGKFPTIGTSDFTMEAWVYTTTISAGASGIFDMWNGGTTAFLLRRNGGDIQFYVQGGSNIGVTAMVANTWTHLAIVKSGTTITLYKDGVSIGIPITSYSTSITSTAALGIGGTATSGSECWNGYISNARIVVGTALYTANFLPPQAPLTPVANTQLLTCQTNGGATNNGFVDQSSFNNIINRNGNTTQGTFSPYSQNGWSNYLGGLGNYLSVPYTVMGTVAGDFTIESWVYPIDAGRSQDSSKIGTIAAGYLSGSITNCWAVNLTISGGVITTLSFTTNDTTRATATGLSISINAWHHFSVARSGSTITIYVDGTSVGTGSYGTSFTTNSSGSIWIGQSPYGSTYQNWLQGYFSNVRFVNGTAIVPPAGGPTAPVTAVTNTTLLTCQSPRFVDNGPNNYTITTAGTPSTQAYSPFGGVTSVPTSYSTYFNGSTDYLTLPYNSSYQFGTNDFTIEMWLNFSATGNIPVLGNLYSAGAHALSLGWQIVWNTTATAFRFFYNSTSTANYVTFNSFTPTLGVWYHVAIVRSGGNATLYINGTSYGTVSLTANIVWSSGNMYVGSYNNNLVGWWPGYISNIRVVNGTAIVPPAGGPTAPLTAVSNTSLLICQNNTMVDNSNNYFTLTANGSPKVYTYNPFGMTTTTGVSYTPLVNGGSMYFDGTGDYLSSSTAPSTLPGNFTLEYWYYATSALSNSSAYLSFGTETSGRYLFTINSTGVQYNQYGVASTTIATYTFNINTWYHVAIVRTGTSLSAYVNGVNAGTVTLSGSLGNGLGFYIQGASTGATASNPYYLSDLRITNGTALYAANFYPGPAPGTPTTTIGANTYTSQLYLTGTSGGIIDQSGKTTLETVGDTKFAPETPYAGSYYSNYFDGDGDGLLTSSGFAIGSGDFTIEFWVNYTDTTTDTNDRRIISQGASASTTALNISTLPSVTTIGGVSQPAGSIYFGGSNYWIGTNLAVNDGIWHHIVFARQTGTTRCFVDGVLKQTVSTSYTLSTSTAYAIGYYITGGITTGNWNGYISNLRVVVGTSLYNSAFTAHTSPLTAISNTQLLTCQSNKFVDNSTNAFTITTNGNTAVKSFNPFQRNIGQSYYFDGTGDYLYSNATQLNYGLQFTSGDYTVEYWVNPTSLTTAATHFNLGFLKANTTASTGTTTVYGGSAGTTLLITGAAITGGQWTHVAVTRQSGVGTTLWINGTRSGATAVDSTSYANSTMFIGSTNAATYPFTGYLTDFRITKGTARYTANNTAYLNSGSPYMNK